ncbi:MAG TPA: GFA family protein [Burkholderiales bacterium]|nr:GFA family protein [Burkholderiales bacterium]
MAEPVTGSCLCGAIRFSIAQPIQELRACHCRNCQKASGAGGSVNAVVPSAAFRITQGTPKRYSARADSGRLLHRYFCGDCGSPIYSQRDATPETVVVRAGLLDNAGPMKITANVWTGSARPWSHIDSSSTQHPGQPDAPAKT